MEIIRLKINVNGIVQGVGFRPFVYRIARKNNLTGFVRNNSCGVEIEVEGNAEDVEIFKSSLKSEAPPLSEITQIEILQTSVQHSAEFKIVSSGTEISNQTLISPDIAICDDCMNELFDPKNRRYHYPFINCTNCGPRLTIIENIPYDRKYTTMQKFKMCQECEKEYNDPNDRRFHAQPNACPKCGPNVWYESKNTSSKTVDHEAISHAVRDLIEGKIVSVKGLGGFHLAVDANNDDAVKRLRLLKRREEKPFAVMVRSTELLADIVHLSDKEKILLLNYKRPILLLKKNKCTIAESVAPNNKRLGVMLAYTPLHHIILHEFERHLSCKNPLLVMTSANFSEEPIEITNDGAKETLGNVADGFLFHNRDILIRADDSVSIVINDVPRIFRRSRGYVPKPIFTRKSKIPILGVGAELKNTICLLKDDKAFISQHIGDLTNFSASQFFKETISYTQKIIDCKAEKIVYDLHPDYLSTKWAKEENILSILGVQHHHAHMAACMGEHNLYEDVIGIILDGTGYGIDGTIWGGEVLVGGLSKVKRYAHLELIPLPGGDAAIKDPWRIAVSYLYHTFGEELPQFDFTKRKETEVLIHMLKNKINAPVTSSAGRLFDAVSVICGGPQQIRYEAQAAIELMQRVDSIDVDPYPFDKNSSAKSISVTPLIGNIVQDVQRKMSIPVMSAKFHKTFALMLIDKAESARKEYGINNVVLSGGVFQNEISLKIFEDELRKSDFNVYSHSNIPTNDGGISFGQVMIARELMEKGLNVPEFDL